MSTPNAPTGHDAARSSPSTRTSGVVNRSGNVVDANAHRPLSHDHS